MARPVSTRTCDIEGCERKHCAKGLCRRHYSERWVAGNEEYRARHLEKAKLRYWQDRDAALARARDYREANRDEIVARKRKRYYQRLDDARNYHIRKKYGLTPEAWQALLNSQDGRCKVCSCDLTAEGARPVVDHCHKTGTVRAILCVQCNTGIGQLRDDPALVWRAAQYLASHSEIREAA